MRRRLAALAAAALVAGSGSAVAPADGAGRRGATAVGVAEREFRISVYRKVVPPGLVRLNIRNFGEDAHDLVVFGPRGFTPVSSGEIRSGRTARLELRLRRAGRYRLVCSEADHAERGMRAVLEVRRPRR